MFQGSSWVLPYWEVLFFALMQLVAVFEKPNVRDIRHRYLGHAFLQQVPSLMVAAQVVYHPHLHLHLHPCLVHELDRLVFALTWQRLHVSSGDQIAHATWSLADTQDSSSPTQYVPAWSTQLERNTDQKLDMYNLVSIPSFPSDRGKKWGKSPVSSTSTLVEQVGVVGKWIMQLSKQDSDSQWANTKAS